MGALFPDSDLNQNAGSDDAVQISVSGNVVTIDVFVDIQGDTTTMIPNSSGGYYSTLDLTIQGLESISGVYVGVFGQIVAVEVDVHQGSSPSWACLPREITQNFVPVNLHDRPGVSTLTRPRSGWSPASPGAVDIFSHFDSGDPRTYWQFRNVSIHEFLHMLGVNDANREWRRNEDGELYSDRPDADMLDDIFLEVMGFGIHEQDMHISQYTIMMMIYALTSGEWQRFMEYEGGPQSNVFNANIQKG